MSNQPDRPWDRTAPKTKAGEAKKSPSWQRWLGVAGAVLVFLAIAYSCGSLMTGSSNSSASECRSLASDRYGAGVESNRFTEVTFTDGDFVKGTIGAIVDGSERIVGHWECSTESGSAVITFYSDAS